MAKAKNKWVLPTIIAVVVIGGGIGAYFMFKKPKVDDTAVPATDTQAQSILSQLKEAIKHPFANAGLILEYIKKIEDLGYSYDKTTGKITKK